MAKFQCKECGYEQEAVASMLPLSCKKCNAKGKGIWIDVSSSKTSGTQPPSSAPPTPSVPGKSTNQGKIGGKMPDPAGMPLPLQNRTQGSSPPPKQGSSLPPSKSQVNSKAPSPPPMVKFRGDKHIPASPDPSSKKTSLDVHSSQAGTTRAELPTQKLEPKSPVAPPINPGTPTAEQESPVDATSPIKPQRTQSDRVVWSFPQTASESLVPQRNCPAIDDSGRLYLASNQKLIAFENLAGEFRQLWSYETGGRILGSPVIGSDGNIRVHSEDGHLHFVSLSGDRICQPTQVGEPLGWTSPLVDTNDDTWLCGYHGGLQQIDSSGQLASRPYFRSKQRFDSTGIIYDNVLYLGAENSCVYAIPLGKNRGANTWNHLEHKGSTGWFINSALALASGPTLVVASRDDRLYGFNLQGEKQWCVDVNGQMLGSPIIDEQDSMYVGLSISIGRESPRGELIRIAGLSHKIIWRFSTNAAVESTPVLGDDGTVYFGDNEGFIYAVDSNGEQLWAAQAGAAVRSPGTILSSGHVVFGLENGQFVALPCDSKSLRSNSWGKYMGNTRNCAQVNAT